MLFRFALLLVFLIALAGCASSQSDQNQPQYPNLVSVNPPNGQKNSPSKAYIDSVKMIDHKGNKALLISGNMANGCTYLLKATHTAADDSLSISLTAWKPADKICSQALVPFSFIYDELSAEELNKRNTMSINQKSFKLKQ